MKFSNILSLAAMASSTVLADGAAIVSALGTINTKTLALQGAVTAWTGDVFGAIPIVVKSAHLLASIKKGTGIAEASANLTAPEALSVAGAVQTMASTVNTTITALIDKHGKFQHLLMAPVVLLNLEAEKSSTNKLSAAIISKVPEPLQGVAKNLVVPITASFEQGIDAFSLSNGI